MWNKDEFKELKKDIDNLVTEVFGDDFFKTEKEKPKYYHKKENGFLKIAIPMPGIAKENIKVHFQDGNLVVEGNQKNWYTTSNYITKFRLIDCDENSVKAEMKNGVLELTIKEIEKKRTIEIL